MGDLAALKERVFASDNKACFIERERILARLEKEMDGYDAPDRYARILAQLLAGVSVPVQECDYFAGRVVEALPDEGMSAPSTLLVSVGHMHFDYASLLRLGLGGMLERIRCAAAEKDDADARSFAENAATVVYAIRDYAARYAQATEEKGFVRMAAALRQVPFGPAPDLYSALQSMWLVHMIASCYVGSRDYAFGRFDQYLLPYYEQALEAGESEDELTELLAGFFIKTNEICGRATHNHACKPVLSQASKQYVNIGGEAPNRLSMAVLNAAKKVSMAQPQIVVLLKPDADEAFTDAVFDALAVLDDKMNVYNYDLVLAAALEKGIPEDIARGLTYSACCTFDLDHHSVRWEYFAPVPQLFLEVLHGGDYTAMEELTQAFVEKLRCDLQKFADFVRDGCSKEDQRKYQVLDSVLLSDSAAECRYACDGGGKYNMLNLFFPGVATVGDSLMVLDRLVFKEKRYTFREFAAILKNDFAGQEALHREILRMTKFGNDTPADDYAALAGRIMLDAADALDLKPNFFAVPGFYSLERDNLWSADIGATPDGRKAGEPFSENQSPTYGADKNGITALLKSLSCLPFERTVDGGLNLTFSRRLPPELLRGLVLSYFRMGGIHVGISVVDRAVLQDAMVTPEKYKSLTVRLYGFSEYFISLPEWQQLAILERTGYAG